MAQLSVGSAEPAGFVGTASVHRPLPSGALIAPDFLARAALRKHPYVREHEGGMTRWDG
jgi:hypothetical protein